MIKMIPLILLFLLFNGAIAGNVVVITHKSTPDNEINKSRLLDFYSHDIRYWDNGEPVVLIDLKEKTETKKQFYKFIGRSTSRMKTLWMKHKLSGEGDPPKAVSDEKTMLETISSTPGSIGFVDADMVLDSVKILLIINEDEDSDKED